MLFNVKNLGVVTILLRRVNSLNAFFNTLGTAVVNAYISAEQETVGSTYSVLHIVAYSPIFKDFVSHIKCATYCVLHFFNVI